MPFHRYHSAGFRGKYINSLGYAVSSDGVNFKRFDKPVLSNDIEQEARGPEDPRIVEIDGIFHMMYMGYGARFPGDYRISHATSSDLVLWTRQGVILDEPNKDASLFPEKINGLFILLHRRSPNIWLATSEDRYKWQDHKMIMQVLPESEGECEKAGNLIGLHKWEYSIYIGYARASEGRIFWTGMLHGT